MIDQLKVAIDSFGKTEVLVKLTMSDLALLRLLVQTGMDVVNEDTDTEIIQNLVMVHRKLTAPSFEEKNETK